MTQRSFLRALLLALVGGTGILLAGCGTQSPELAEAETALEQGDYEAALQNADAALAQDSTITEAYLFKANVLRQKADSNMTPDAYIELFRRARKVEDEAIEVDADVRDEVREERRRIYAREIERGEDAYNRASKDELPRVFRRAIAFFGAAAATQPDSARPLINEAFARLRVGQKKSAIPALERYVERADTARLEAYKILGQLYVSNGRHEAAVELLDRAVKIYPEERSFQALRLSSYNRSGDVDEALAAYREQIEQNPDRPSYRYMYGALLLKAERYREAIDQLTQAIELRPDHAEGQYNLGAAYLNAAQAREDSIQMIREDETALGDTTMSPTERIGQLVERRQALYEQAIPPLERARKLTQERFADIPDERALRRSTCRALLVAYVRTGRPGKAAQVEECTGFSETSR